MLDRKITVKVAEVISKLQENKTKNGQEYEKAKIAYKKKALALLSKLTKDIEDGKTAIRINLVEPIDRSLWYAEKIAMFQWEQNETADLNENEFKEYILDKSHEREITHMSNMTYLMEEEE